jgi:hypothetical protein
LEFKNINKITIGRFKSPFDYQILQIKNCKLLTGGKWKQILMSLEMAGQVGTIEDLAAEIEDLVVEIEDLEAEVLEDQGVRVVVDLTDQEKCIKRLALSVRRNVKFLSNQQKEDRFIAEIASRAREKDFRIIG